MRELLTAAVFTAIMYPALQTKTAVTILMRIGAAVGRLSDEVGYTLNRHAAAAEKERQHRAAVERAIEAERLLEETKRRLKH